MFLVVYTKPFILVSIISSQSSRSALSAPSRPKANPALLHKTEILLKFGGRLSIAYLTDLLSLTSNDNGNEFLPNSFAISSNLSPLLPVIIVCQPLSLNNLAVALPKPEVAPVIKIVLGNVELILTPFSNDFSFFP